MQVTESYLTNYLSSDVNASSAALNKTTEQLASGLAITQPSDNPAGTSQILSLNDTLANITQYQTDAASATNSLSYTDSQLQSVQNLLTDAKSLAVAAANGGTQSTDVQAANVAQISSILTQMTNLANSQVNGNYIFAGTATSTEPYPANDPTYTYQGNASAINTTVGPNQQIQVNTPGSAVFTQIFSALQGLQTDIASGNATAISNTDLANIATANSAVDDVRANIGSSIDQLTNVTSSLSTAQGELQNQLSSVQNVDIAQVYTQMQTDQNVYQASLEATAETFKYSLADFITV